MLSVALVGYGYWGVKLARACAATLGVHLRRICDQDSARLTLAAAAHPDACLCERFMDVLADRSIDAVIIATPATTHAALAAAALGSGRPVFVEKPMTTDSDTASDLVDLAERRRLTLMVDHPYLFTPAIRTMTTAAGNGDLGALGYYDSVRTNYGGHRDDVSVIWDLAVHDVAILDAILGAEPECVSATAGYRLADGRPSQAFVTLFYPREFVAHVHVSWIAPEKTRRMILAGTERMIVADDLGSACPLRIVGRGIQPVRIDVAAESSRAAETIRPSIEHADALACAVAHFVTCVETGGRLLTDGASGVRTVRVLEAIDASVNLSGAPVRVATLVGA